MVSLSVMAKSTNLPTNTNNKPKLQTKTSS